MPELPKELQEAIAAGELTKEQLRELISLEAKAIGLSAAEAISRAQDNTLPPNYLGADISLLVELLQAA